MSYREMECPRKAEARKSTIVEMYRTYFSESLPETKQYWTMCGPHARNGVFIEESEMGQVLKAGLIKPHQFIGVDIDEEIIAENRIARPDVLWIHDDFLKAMTVSFAKGLFKPGVINADFICLKERGSFRASEIMALLEDIDCRGVMLVANIMLMNPHTDGNKSLDAMGNGKSVIKEFERWSSFQYAWGMGKWVIHPEFYTYRGTGKNSHTTMGSFVFARGVG